jgi:hypothetical protein
LSIVEAPEQIVTDPALIQLAKEQFSLRPVGTDQLIDEVPPHQDTIVLTETATILRGMASALPTSFTEDKLTAHAIADRLSGISYEGGAHEVEPADLSDAAIILRHFKHVQRQIAIVDATETIPPRHNTQKDDEPPARWAPNGKTTDRETYIAKQSAATLNTLLTMAEKTGEPLDPTLEAELRAAAGPHVIVRKKPAYL